MIPTDKNMFCLALVASFLFMLQEMCDSRSPIEQVSFDEDGFTWFDTDSEEESDLFIDDFDSGPVVCKVG